MPGYLDSVSNTWWGWDDGEDNWGSPTNRSLRQIAYGGIHKTVRQSNRSLPPINPTLGDSYIVGNNPTGDWSAYRENDVVVWGRDETTPLTIAWQRFQPRVGWLVYDQSGSRVLVFNGSSWGELQNTSNSPIRVDGTSITGDGVTTDLQAHFTQQQADWNTTNTGSPSHIRNIPSAIRNYTPPLDPPLFWYRKTFSGTGRAAGSENRDLIRLATIRLSSQLGLAYNMGGTNVIIGAFVTVRVTQLQSTSRIYVGTHTLDGNPVGRTGRKNSSNGQALVNEFITSSGNNEFSATLQVYSNAADNFSYSGQLTAGIKYP